jgi:hypothetical protein
MSDPRSPSLLRPGAPEWRALDDEKHRLLTPPPGTPVEELLRAGQQLSEQAALLLGAIERPGERPARSA